MTRVEFPTAEAMHDAMIDARREVVAAWRKKYPPIFPRREMPDMNQQALRETGLLDAATNNIDQQQDVIAGLAMNVRSFCDGLLGPAISRSAGNSPPLSPPPNVPETRGSKLSNSINRLATSVKELNDEILRLQRI